MFVLCFTLIIAQLLGISEAKPWASWEWAAPLGCGIQLNSLPWRFEPDVRGSYADICNYEPALGSWTTCIHEILVENYDEREYGKMLAKTLNTINMCCAMAGGGLAQLSQKDFNSSLENATNYIVDISKLNLTQSISYPVELNTETRQNIVSAVRKNFANFASSNSASSILYYFCAISLVLLLVSQLKSVNRFLFRAKPVNIARASIEIPPFHKTHTARSTLSGFVPTRFEIFLIAIYSVLHTLALFYGYDIDEKGTLDPVGFQYLRVFGVRSGIVAFWQFPLLMALGTRSNILELLAGIKFSTVVVFHKWISRIMVFDAVVHSVAFEIHGQLTGKIVKESQELFWRRGVYATYLSCVICILSLGTLRKKCYEVFLYLHIAFAMVFFYLCWIHAKKFGWLWFIYSSCIIWAIERSLRIIYISKFGLAHAVLQQAGSDLFTVKVPKPKYRAWNSVPGQYVFLYFLTASTFWQSHPFTFTDMGDELYFVIKAKEGATGVILQRLKLQGGTMTIPVFVEGPYGSPKSLLDYDQTLFLCGGSGLPGPLSEAYELSLTKPTETIFVVIVARDLDILEAFREQMIRLKGLHVQLYMTGLESDSFDLPGVHTNHGRPNLDQIIEDFASNTSSLAVSCCGPPGFNDEARSSVARAISHFPNRRIEYFEEYQIW